MSISASISFFVKPEHLEAAKNIIDEHIPAIECEHEAPTGTLIHLGYVNYDAHRDILDDLKTNMIEAECTVVEVSSTEIENFTVQLTNVDGVMVENSTTYSGQRVIDELGLCLAQITNGVSLEELKLFIEDKIAKTC